MRINNNYMKIDRMILECITNIKDGIFSYCILAKFLNNGNDNEQNLEH